MIRKLLFIFFLFGLFANGIYGQDSLAYKSKWQIRLLAGADLPITKISQGTETDNLLQFDNSSFYLQPMYPITISYFFSKHWGVEFNMQGSISRVARNRNDRFVADMQLQYGDRFYVNTTSTGNSDLDLSDIFSIRGFLGVIYRFETDKYYVYPKFSIGLTSFNTDRGNVNLKEKNSNNEFRITYSSGDKLFKEYFTLAPSVSFGYKISKRFFLNADIMFSHFKTNFVYEKTTTNLLTNEMSMEYFDYKKDILTLSLGVGLIFVIH
jgi:outer membrane protein W